MGQGSVIQASLTQTCGCSEARTAAVAAWALKNFKLKREKLHVAKFACDCGSDHKTT